MLLSFIHLHLAKFQETVQMALKSCRRRAVMGRFKQGRCVLCIGGTRALCAACLPGGSEGEQVGGVD